MILMYRLHRYEYNRHACKLISLQCAILFSLCYAVMGFYSVTLVAGCVLTERGLVEPGDPKDLCYNIFSVGSVTPE